MFTVILGSDEKASRLYEAIKADLPNSVRLIQAQELGGLATQASASVSNIVVADSEIKAGSALADTLIGYKLRGVKVESAADCFEKRNRKVWIDGVSPEWLIFANGFNPSKVYLGFKRSFDLLLSITLLIVFAPLMLLVA